MAIHRELGKCLTDFLMSFSRLLRIYHHCNNWDIIILSIHRVVDWLYSFKHFLQRIETSSVSPKTFLLAGRHADKLLVCISTRGEIAVSKQQNAVFIRYALIKKRKRDYLHRNYPPKKSMVSFASWDLRNIFALQKITTSNSGNRVNKIPTYSRVF